MSQRQKDATRRKAYYVRNKPSIVQRVNRYRKSIAAWLDEYKKTLRCASCGEDHPACLNFHHRDPKEKRFTIGSMRRHGCASMGVLKAEIAKCVVSLRELSSKTALAAQARDPRGVISGGYQRTFEGKAHYA